MDILDTNGKVIASPGSAYGLSKVLANDSKWAYVSGKPMANNGFYIAWDGTVYDQATGSYAVAPEGDYAVRLQARIRENGQWQTLTMPLSVDLTGPELSSYRISRSGRYLNIRFKASDPVGLHSDFAIALNDQTTSYTFARCEYDEESGYYTARIFAYGLDLPEDAPIHTALMVMDAAGNTSLAYYTINPDDEAPAYGLGNLVMGEKNYVRAESGITYFRAFGYAPVGSTVTFNGKAAEFNGENFSIVLPLTEGDNVFDVVIRDAEGSTLLSGQTTICATNFTSVFSAPILGQGFKGMMVGDGWTMVLDQDYPDGTEIPIRIRIADPENMTVYCNSFEVQPDENGYVDFSVYLYGGSVQYSIQVNNKTGGYYGAWSTIWNHTAAQEAVQQGNLNLTPVYRPEVWYSNGFAGVTPDMLQEDGSYRLRGFLFNAVDRLTVNGQEVTVNPDDLTWSCDIILQPGVNNIPVIATQNGVNYPASNQKLLFETAGPELTLELPESVGGIHYVDTASYLLRGTVATYLDDGQVYLNDTCIFGSTNFAHAYGEEKITREFSYELALQPGNNIFTVSAYNYLGLSTEQTFNLFLGEKPPVCNHETTEVHGAKDATCTEDGYTGDVYCIVCGELLEQGQVIPSTGHTAGEPVKEHEVAATCTEDGSYDSVVYCTVCHAELSRETQVIPAAGHGETEIRNAKEATCTEDGYTGDEVCTICNEILKKGEVIPALGCPSAAFTDLNTGAWYHEFTDYVISRGLMIGMSDTRFAPETNLTRGMLVTTLYRLAGSPEVTEPTTFTDVAEDRYFTDAIAWAQAVGVAKGMADTRFAPNQSVTREQAMTFLYRYAEYLNREPVTGGDLSQFADAERISPYAREAMAWAVAEGLLEGYGDGTVGPQNSVTRAQMAKFLTVLDRAF